MRLAVLACLLLWGGVLSAQYRQAGPGYRYEFPRDHFDHQEFRSEWWYFTGNLRADDGHELGYELTFFRQNVQQAKAASPWAVDDVYLAHLALTDISGQRFFHDERLNRRGPGLAGVDEAKRVIWNGNWRLDWQEPLKLAAVSKEFRLDLTLALSKPPVIQGENGFSQKGPEPGRGSHYVSLPRLATQGTVMLQGKQYRVTGQSWMDHEWFSSELDQQLQGWDWFAVQLDNGDDLMLYRLRSKDGRTAPFSSGTYIPKNGPTRHLQSEELSLQPGPCWTSPDTKACYPLHWQVRIPVLQLEFSVTTPFNGQELASRHRLTPTYWEGAVRYRGTMRGQPVTGKGYLELTGYDRALRLQGSQQPRDTGATGVRQQP